MKKVLLIALALIMVLAPIARAEGQGEPMAEAQKSFQPFELDGEEVKIGGYLINANNYYNLRDLAALLNGTDKEFNVIFDNEKKQIALELGKGYEKLDTDLQEMKHDKTTAKMVTNTILVDGKEVELKAALIDRNNYVKLRDLGPVVGFIVDYNRETKAIIVDTKSEAKVEEKAEEKSEDKKEEKSEEKKDQVKTTDPNLTHEEIAKFLNGKAKREKMPIAEYELVKGDDGVDYLYKNEDGDEAVLTIIKYEPFNKAENDKRIAVQSELYGNMDKFAFSWENTGRLYFLSADRIGQKSIDVLSIVKDFAYVTTDGNKLGLDMDGIALVAPNKTNNEYFTLGYVVVYTEYSDGTAIQSTQEKPIREIPLYKGDAKLSEIVITVYLGDDNNQYGLVFID